MTTRVLETVLVGRDLLSPVLARAGGSVATFNAAVSASSTQAASAATTGATVQSTAGSRVAASNARVAESATVSAATQSRAHTQAAQSASLAARAQETANSALARSNGMLGTSLTPLTAGLGLVGVGLGYAAFRGMEFDTSMSRVQAATQATAGTMGELREAAVTAGADTQFSAVEAAGGITELAKAGVSARDIMAGGLKGALDLAAAGEMEVADAAEIAATAVQVFNLSGAQVPHVADLLAAGAGKAQGSVYDLGMALNQSALVAEATGLSIEETAGSLAAFASQGLIGSDAGTSFRSMLLHLQNPSKEAAETMASLGVNMYDANGAFVGMEALAGQLQTRMAGLSQAERDKAMATIFGSDAVRAANVLYEQGAQGIAEWTAKVNDSGYASRQAAQLNDNLRGDLERLGGAFDALMTSFGEGAQGPLRDAVQMLTFLVNTGADVLSFFTSLPGWVQTAVIAFAAFTALRGPLTSLFETVALKVMYFGDSLAGVATRTGGFSGAMSSLAGAINPVTLALTLATIGITEYMRESAEVEARMEAAADAGESFRSTLLDQAGQMNATTREAAALAVEAAGLTEVFNELQVSSKVVQDALAGNSDAYLETAAALEEYDQRQTATSNGFIGFGVGMDWLTGKSTENADAFRELSGVIETTDGKVANFTVSTLGGLTPAAEGAAEATHGIGDAAQATVEQVDAAAEAVEAWREELQGIADDFVDPLETYKGLLQEKTDAERAQAEATAAATEDSSDSWRDYVSDVDVSLDEYANRLQEQLDNQESWRVNLVAIAEWAGTDVANRLAQMGKDGVDLVAKMADGTTAEAQRMAEQIRREIQLGGGHWTADLDMAMKVMEALGRQGSAATVQSIAAELRIGVDEAARILQLYGVNLAGSINPILSALGKGTIQPGTTIVVGSGRFAEGGLVEDHSPQIAAGGGPVRIWAEPETQGEAYIPLADDHRRPRALSIWRETGRRLGVDVEEYAYGGVKPAGRPGVDVQYFATGGEIFNLAKSAFPRAKLNSSYRPGDPGYHGKNMAADLGEEGFAGGDGRPYIAAMKRWFVDNYGRANEIIYNGLGNDRTNIKDGKAFAYSAATQAEHHNHLHVAIAGAIAAAMGGPGGGPGGVAAPAMPTLPPVPQFPYNGIAGSAPKVAEAMRETAQAFLDAQAAAMSPSGPGEAGSGPVREQVNAVASKYGWGAGAQWAALDRLIQKESSWNPTAQNPTSTAYGLFQFLNSTWAQTGIAKTSNPGLQAEAGSRYIKARYTDPIGALAFHNAHNWYDDGGVARGRGYMPKYTAAPERVLSPRQTEAFEQWMDRGELVAPAAQRGYGAGCGHSVVHHHHYDESRRTEIAVDASNRDHRGIAKAVAAGQRDREWLASPR